MTETARARNATVPPACAASRASYSAFTFGDTAIYASDGGELWVCVHINDDGKEVVGNITTHADAAAEAKDKEKKYGLAWIRRVR